MAKNKVDKLYTMQLTKEEVLMLQQSLEGERKTVLSEYSWEAKIRDSLEAKAGALYQKPSTWKKSEQSGQMQSLEDTWQMRSP